METIKDLINYFSLFFAIVSIITVIRNIATWKSKIDQKISEWKLEMENVDKLMQKDINSLIINKDLVWKKLENHEERLAKWDVTLWKINIHLENIFSLLKSMNKKK